MPSFDDFHSALLRHLAVMPGPSLGAVGPDQDLLEILDSLALIQVLFALEQEFQIEFPFDRLTPEMVQNSRRIHAVIGGVLAA